jgi:hypothetical protein
LVSVPMILFLQSSRASPLNRRAATLELDHMTRFRIRYVRVESPEHLMCSFRPFNLTLLCECIQVDKTVAPTGVPVGNFPSDVPSDPPSDLIVLPLPDAALLANSSSKVRSFLP